MRDCLLAHHQQSKKIHISFITNLPPGELKKWKFCSIKIYTKMTDQIWRIPCYEKTADPFLTNKKSSFHINTPGTQRLTKSTNCHQGRNRGEKCELCSSRIKKKRQLRFSPNFYILLTITQGISKKYFDPPDPRPTIAPNLFSMWA
jgi:hypothetical protein